MGNKPEARIGYRYFLGFMILFVIIHFYHWRAGLKPLKKVLMLNFWYFFLVLPSFPQEDLCFIRPSF